MIWGYGDILGLKIIKEKLPKFHKGFELYQEFIHGLWDKMFGYSHIPYTYIYIYIYCLQEESTRLGLRMTIFFSGGTRTFLVNKIIQEKLIKFPNIFELYKS